jgi:hypothetical protein
MPNGFRKYIHLRQGHPDSFRFAVRVPAGGSVVPHNGGAQVLDGQGNPHLNLPAPWGLDSSNGDPLDGRGQPVRVEMEWGVSYTEPSGNHIQVFRFVPNQNDLDSAVYPVLLDPTATISGPATIEDVSIYRNSGNNNYGAFNALVLLEFVPFNWRTLIRAPAGSYPAGTITGYRWISQASQVGTAGDINAHLVKSANGDYLEGTKTGATEVGSVCWNKKIYNTTNWAGSVGCGTSGTDFVADGSPPSVNVSAINTPYTLVLTPQSATDARDGTNEGNSGIRLVTTGAGDLVFYSSDHATVARRPYFEVDYVAAGGTAQRFFFMRAS